MKTFWLCFVPLFVAVDAVGVLPMFLSLTEGLDEHAVKRVVIQSVLTAMIVALSFLAVGPLLLQFLGITIPDFMIAGGVLLFAISLKDLLMGEKRPVSDVESLGAVPIGVPLITGPAVLTTGLLLANSHGRALAATAVAINIVLAGVVFWFAVPIARWLGRTGTKTISKVASLLLAAIAVMLARRGLTYILSGAPP
jgi:multiple antibiotic resistance protein